MCTWSASLSLNRLQVYEGLLRGQCAILEMLDQPVFQMEPSQTLTRSGSGSCRCTRACSRPAVQAHVHGHPAMSPGLELSQTLTQVGLWMAGAKTQTRSELILSCVYTTAVLHTTTELLMQVHRGMRGAEPVVYPKSSTLYIFTAVLHTTTDLLMQVYKGMRGAEPVAVKIMTDVDVRAVKDFKREVAVLMGAAPWAGFRV